MSQTRQESKTDDQSLRSDIGPAANPAIGGTISESALGRINVERTSIVRVNGITQGLPLFDLTIARSIGQIVPELPPLPFWYRALERLIAAAMLIVFSPVMLAVALIIRRGTPGPALFFQKRLGIGAKPFTFEKFRTMYVDARERFSDRYQYKYSDEELAGLHFKTDNDPRLTPQGKWLRRTTLDELPNFYAVLKGEMSLVGPRPEIPEMLPYYQGDMLKKFSVLPGITGLAQTCGRGHLNFFDTVKYDLEYVENRSIWLNLKIICRTVKIVFTSHGAF
jgi:lipopolysaccharide/colanic/teichoic acid biosynthesis glycosyltransferase